MRLSPPLSSDSYSNSASDSTSDSVSIVVESAALYFSVSRSIPSFYHHPRDTLAPFLCMARSQRSRIGRVAMYCATVFCLLVTAFQIPSNPHGLLQMRISPLPTPPFPRLYGAIFKCSRKIIIYSISTYPWKANKN